VGQAVTAYIRALPWLRWLVYMSGLYRGSSGYCTYQGSTVAQVVSVYVRAVPWLKRLLYMSDLYRGSGG